MEAFTVQVIGCTELLSDCPLKNVGVRVSLASISTGQLLKKSESSQKVLSQYEKSSYIPQFTTRGIDCNSLPSFSAIWNETFIVNEDSKILMNPDNVMIFEVIDYTIHKGRHFFNSVAFAYLKLKSTDGHTRNTNKKLKLQLYEYPAKFNSAVIGTTLPVLSLMEAKKPIDARLAVEVDEIFSSEIERTESRPENVYQKEVSSKTLDELLDDDDGLNDLYTDDATNYSVKRVCQIPRYLNVQIPAGEHGALCLRFNRAGTILAAAIQNNNDYFINFYNTSSFSLISTFPAHVDLIYELAFSYSDEMLMSVSSDGNARIWHGDGTPTLIATLATTNFLYTGKFHPLNDNIVATAGYDGVIRIWDVSKEKILYQLSEHKIRINSLVFSPNGKQLFAGDASGCISVWDVNLQNDTQFVLQKMVAEGEIKSLCITNLSMGRSNLSLLVTTQDNTVRNFETKVMVPSQRFVGTLCSKYMMEAMFSPDAKYVFAGSENGSVCIWDVKENDQVSVIEWSHKFKNPVTTIAWNHRFDMCAFSSFGDGEPILIYKDTPFVKAPRRRPMPKSRELSQAQDNSQAKNQNQDQNISQGDKNKSQDDQQSQSGQKSKSRTSQNDDIEKRKKEKETDENKKENHSLEGDELDYDEESLPSDDADQF